MNRISNPVNSSSNSSFFNSSLSNTSLNSASSNSAILNNTTPSSFNLNNINEIQILVDSSVKKQTEILELKLKSYIDEKLLQFFLSNQSLLSQRADLIEPRSIDSNFENESYVSPEELNFIKTKSCSASNFGVNLMLHCFSEQELLDKNQNIMGRTLKGSTEKKNP